MIDTNELEFLFEFDIDDALPSAMMKSYSHLNGRLRGFIPSAGCIYFETPEWSISLIERYGCKHTVYDLYSFEGDEERFHSDVLMLRLEDGN
jgi:hypothetical protein